jgi:hypothetical protein
MNQRRRVYLTPFTSMLVASTVSLASTGCLVSSTEVVNTDRTYLLGPRTESVPGTATRDVTMRALDTHGTIAFHLDRARECKVTSTPRYQRVHVEGKIGKNVAGGIITGALLVAAAGGLIAASTLIEDGTWAVDEGGNQSSLTGAGWVGVTGVIVGIAGLVILPRGIYHAAVSGTTVTPGEVELGTPPPSAVRPPKGYNPDNPEVNALLPRMEQPQYDVLAFGAKPAEKLGESLRSARLFDRAVSEPAAPADPALIGFPDSSGGSNEAMKACVEKYTPSCQSKCSGDKSCMISCLRKPCVENLDKESEPGAEDPRDEYRTVITRTEVCERSSDGNIAIALTVKDMDGVPKTIDIGKTNGAGDVKKDLLAGLEGAYPGWPDSKTVILQEAQVVLVEDPTVVLGKLDLGKYPGLRYAEHIQSTKKQRDALALVEQQRKEKEAKDRQAQLEAAAKAADDALHADERKAEAAKKAQACLSQHQNKCSADCQGNSACVKKCMQRASCGK